MVSHVAVLELKDDKPAVLILIVMDNGLSHASSSRLYAEVLILIVMDNGLSHPPEI